MLRLQFLKSCIVNMRAISEINESTFTSHDSCNRVLSFKYFTMRHIFLIRDNLKCRSNLTFIHCFYLDLYHFMLTVFIISKNDRYSSTMPLSLSIFESSSHADIFFSTLGFITSPVRENKLIIYRRQLIVWPQFVG